LEHCAEYGLIQRYPVMREESTKVSGNEDIFRYVGVPHALYMEKHGLTMEEYILLLETYPFDGTHLLLRDNANKEYEVYFVSADRNSGLETTAVPVPANLHYAVSGSNANGFFVTVELPEDSGRTYPTDVITTPPRVTTQPAETT
jgi:D-alanyl-D-alanine carboxypeptidase